MYQAKSGVISIGSGGGGGCFQVSKNQSCSEWSVLGVKYDRHSTLMVCIFIGYIHYMNRSGQELTIECWHRLVSVLI